MKSKSGWIAVRKAGPTMTQRKLLFGPPGCGKTYTLINRVGEALRAGVHPSRIVLVSFTRKAIQEAVRRACDAFRLTPKDFPYAKTMHALAFHGLGMTRSNILSDTDWHALGSVLGISFDGTDTVDPDTGILLPTAGSFGSQYVQLIDRSRYRGVSLLQEFREADDYNLSYAKLEQVRKTLEAYKLTHNKVDFVDLIERYPSQAEIPQSDLLIVDEAQDLTPLQWDMVEALAQRAQEAVFAGDDDQAIHAWTGVEVQRFLSAAEDREVLSQSYRMPRSVFDLSQRIVRRISRREPKIFQPTSHQGSVHYHLTLDTIPFHEGSWTVMARTNGYVHALKDWFEEAGYLYSVKGSPSLKRKLADAILAWRHLQKGGALHVSAVKNLYENLYKQGEKAAVRRGASTLLESADPTKPYSYEDLVSGFGLTAPKDRDAMDTVRVTSTERQYIAALERRGEDIGADPRIKLSTFHAMKGGEDDNCVVYIASTKACVNAPNQDDEHRAFYVGVSRARINLHILDTDKRYKYDL
jgi:superfamily I DNA/RNA helicase